MIHVDGSSVGTAKMSDTGEMLTSTDTRLKNMTSANFWKLRRHACMASEFVVLLVMGVLRFIFIVIGDHLCP